MNNTKNKFKENVRHVSIRKKTASRICSTQVLYGASFSNYDIDVLINSYVVNYLPSILEELKLKDLDYELLNTIIRGVYKNIFKIDEIIKVPNIDRMPMFHEISDKVLWNEFKNDTYLNSYFPNYPKGLV